MKKRIKKKIAKSNLEKHFKKFCEKELIQLNYKLEVAEEAKSTIETELTAYKQLLKLSQINLEWCLNKILGKKASFEIPCDELVENSEKPLEIFKDSDKNVLVVKRANVK